MHKPALFYFVHAHGAGHCATFRMLRPAIERYFDVIALTTNPNIAEEIRTDHPVPVVELPPKYPPDYVIPEHTFSKPFEVTPYAVEPAVRAQAFAEAIIRYQPVALYCDGVPEIAIMARGMGVPVVLVHLPGTVMHDPTQVFAHELADHIIAHFPAPLEQPDYVYGFKTEYTGYLSRYAGYEPVSGEDANVTILMGSDNYSEALLQSMTSDTGRAFTIIGNNRRYELGQNSRQVGRVEDIAKAITGSVVITAAGQNSLAELFSLRKRLVVLPEPRPYGEQQVHAEQLAAKGLAVLADPSFTADEWSVAIDRADRMKPDYTGLVAADGPETVVNLLKEWYA